jgi:hypothetical protein
MHEKLHFQVFSPAAGHSAMEKALGSPQKRLLRDFLHST